MEKLIEFNVQGPSFGWVFSKVPRVPPPGLQEPKVGGLEPIPD